MPEFASRIIEGFDAPFQIVAAAVEFAICSYAVARGGGPERLSGAAFAVAYVATLLAQDTSDLIDPRLGVLVIDVLMLVLLLAMSLLTDRTWALFAAGFHLLAVMTHAAVAIDPRLHSVAYGVVLNLMGYLVFIALGVGTFGVHRARRRSRRSRDEATSGG